MMTLLVSLDICS